MVATHQPEVWEFLLTRRGLVYVDEGGSTQPPVAMSVSLELASLGYATHVTTSRLCA